VAKVPLLVGVISQEGAVMVELHRKGREGDGGEEDSGWSGG